MSHWIVGFYELVVEIAKTPLAAAILLTLAFCAWREQLTWSKCASAVVIAYFTAQFVPRNLL
jgi:hypothetical protein